MKVLIYTAIFGKKDGPPEINFIQSKAEYSIDFKCFTDSLEIDVKGYDIVTLPITFRDITRNARKIKVLGGGDSHKYDLCIWHDASLRLDPKKIYALIDACKMGAISTFKHAETCVYREARKCIENKKDNPVTIYRQMRAYAKEYFPTNHTVWETGIWAYLPKQSLRFRNLWWANIKKHSRRDQLSFPYSVWQTKCPVNILPGSGFQNQYSNYVGHKYYHYKSPLSNFLMENPISRKLSIRAIYSLEKKMNQL